MRKLAILSDIEMVYVELAVVSCKSRKEISCILHRSIDTVHSQFKNIYRKLEVTEGIAELSRIYFSEKFDIEFLVETKNQEIINNATRIINKVALTLFIFTSLGTTTISSHESINFEYQNIIRIRRNRRRDDNEFAAMSDSHELNRIYTGCIDGKI